MSRIVLVHWKPSEAQGHVGRLRQGGHRVDVYAEQGGVGLRGFRSRPPDAFVIDLSRLPSHGGAVATFLRQQKATRAVPLVFVDGAPEKVDKVRRLLPDAVFTDGRRIRGAVRRALRRPTDAPPVVPGTMQGYSETPLPRKLGIRPGASVALLQAPRGFDKTLGRLPEGVRRHRQARGTHDLVLLFVRSRTALQRRFAAATRCVAADGSLWICWPKKASGMRTDLDQTAVRVTGLNAGWVDFKICAVDATWSGLRFARRRARA